MTLAPGGFTYRFSSADLPTRERLSAYLDLIQRSVGHFDAEPIGDRFEFDVSTLALPDLSVAEISCTPMRVRRTSGMAADDARDLVLTVFRDGAVSAAQLGREADVRSGGALLLSSHDPIIMDRLAPRLTNYSLLANKLAPAIRNLDAALMTAIPADCDAIRLLIGYTRLVTKQAAGSASSEFHRIAASHIYDLIALAIGATRDAAEIAKRRGLRAARYAELYARAERLISLQLDDPALGPDEIAHRFGISTRLLQKVFAERGETVSGRLWAARVSRAANLLAASETADRTVTDIAFACGFNNSAHFTRAFAARMGVTPSAWRKQALQQP